MSKVIIKNELKLELYRDFIKSGVVTNSHGSSRVASQLKYYVENTYTHLIAEGIIEEEEDFEDELQNTKERFFKEHAERMDELNKLTKEMTDSSDSIEKNIKILDEQLKKMKKHESISREQDKISKELDSLLD